MKNSNNTIGNRFHDLLVCSAVPQPLRHGGPLTHIMRKLNSANTFTQYLLVYLTSIVITFCTCIALYSLRIRVNFIFFHLRHACYVRCAYPNVKVTLVTPWRHVGVWRCSSTRSEFRYWMWVVICMHRPLYRRRRGPADWIGIWMDRRCGLNTPGKEILSCTVHGCLATGWAILAPSLYHRS
jgi:hypothetical protein